MLLSSASSRVKSLSSNGLHALAVCLRIRRFEVRVFTGASLTLRDLRGKTTPRQKRPGFQWMPIGIRQRRNGRLVEDAAFSSRTSTFAGAANCPPCDFIPLPDGSWACWRCGQTVNGCARPSSEKEVRS